MQQSYHFDDIQPLAFSRIGLSGVHYKHSGSSLTDRTSNTSEASQYYHMCHELMQTHKQLDFYRNIFESNQRLKEIAHEIGYGQLIQPLFDLKENFMSLTQAQESQESEEDIIALFETFKREMAELSSSLNKKKNKQSLEGKCIELTQLLYQKVTRIQELEQQLQLQQKLSGSPNILSQPSLKEDSIRFPPPSPINQFISQNESEKENHQVNVNLNAMLLIKQDKFTRLRKQPADETLLDNEHSIEPFKYLQVCSSGVQTQSSQPKQILKGYQQVFKSLISACNLVWKLFYKHVSRQHELIRQHQHNSNILLLWYSKCCSQSHAKDEASILSYINMCNQKAKCFIKFISKAERVVLMKA